MIASFKAQIISTMWITSDAEFAGKLSKIRCAQKCTITGTNCFAFHKTSDGCFLLKENRNWMEQRPLKRLTFWIKQGAPNSACDTAMFPFSFGNSRFYIEQTNLKTWSGAGLFCKGKGSKLAQISTAAEGQFVRDIMISFDVIINTVFVGGYKDLNDSLPHSQGWKWLGSEEIVVSSLWSDREPNNKNVDQYCIAIFSKNHSKNLLKIIVFKLSINSRSKG